MKNPNQVISHTSRSLETLRPKKLLNSQSKKLLGYSRSKKLFRQPSQSCSRRRSRSKKLLGNSRIKEAVRNSRSKKLCQTAEAIKTFKTIETYQECCHALDESRRLCSLSLSRSRGPRHTKSATTPLSSSSKVCDQRDVSDVCIH